MIEKDCICSEEESLIMCRLCGNLMRGRMMHINCPSHPKVYNLMGYKHCSRCSCTRLRKVNSKA
uniref:Uncharacterized protein n=1 Tax=Ciona intestinalis TaxID=7719 RepID=H2XX46_CIOIN